MLDAALITELGPGLGFLAVLAYLAFQAFFGARGNNSAYPPRDEKHDDNQRVLSEVQTQLAAGFGKIGRAQDEISDRMKRMEDRLGRMETLGEVIKDRTER